jgi:hypothetical protein
MQDRVRNTDMHTCSKEKTTLFANDNSGLWLTIHDYDVTIQSTYRLRQSKSFLEIKFIFECHLRKEHILKSKYKYKK